MTAGFTPGPWWGGVADSPWCVRRESDDATIAHVEDGGHCNPNIVLIGDDEREANARLIAAAPDLLEACQAYAAWSDAVTEGAPDLRKLREQIRAAISKATGVQS